MFIHPAIIRHAPKKPRQTPMSPRQLVSWWANRFQKGTEIQRSGVWH